MTTALKRKSNMMTQVVSALYINRYTFEASLRTQAGKETEGRDRGSRHQESRESAHQIEAKPV